MLKKVVVGLMIVSCLGMGSFLVIDYNRADRQGPQISFEKEEIFFDANTEKEEMLLEDAKAVDAVDGDVSDSLRIESVYQSGEEEAIVVYVARDHQNNISKNKRIVGYKALEQVESKMGESEEESDQ